MSDLNVLSPDFREFVELLIHHKVKYLLTGGYAVGIYGHPRYTGDIDIWVESSQENIDGLNFSEAYSNSNIIEIDGLLPSFVSLKDLVKNKRATGRGIDLDDLKNLQIEEE